MHATINFKGYDAVTFSAMVTNKEANNKEAAIAPSYLYANLSNTPHALLVHIKISHIELDADVARR